MHSSLQVFRFKNFLAKCLIMLPSDDKGSEIFRHRDHAVDRRFAISAHFLSQIAFSAQQGSQIRQTQDVTHCRILDRRDMGFGFVKQTINVACVSKSIVKCLILLTSDDKVLKFSDIMITQSIADLLT